MIPEIVQKIFFVIKKSMIVNIMSQKNPENFWNSKISILERVFLCGHYSICGQLISVFNFIHPIGPPRDSVFIKSIYP